MLLVVDGFDPSPSFKADLKSAPADVKADANASLKKLRENSAASSLRLHPLKGYPKPTIFKIDVRPDRSWQISFEMDGRIAVLLRLGTHKELDRRPR